MKMHMQEMAFLIAVHCSERVKIKICQRLLKNYIFVKTVLHFKQHNAFYYICILYLEYLTWYPHYLMYALINLSRNVFLSKPSY